MSNPDLVQGPAGVWADLVGQNKVIEIFQQAVAGAAHAMTHAWLVTGPPGSGRSNAAHAFVAALQCDKGGCGDCNACRTSLSGAHPDVTLVRTEKLSIGVEEVRDLIRRAAMSPTLGRYQTIVIEDADRITERGANALLKSIEEPAPKTVWVLCAPTADDVIITIRSRTRRVELVTPSADAIAQLLVRRDNIPSERAAWAARVAQGHIGRARVLGRNDDAVRRRREVLMVPSRLTSLGACLQAAASMVDAATEEAVQATEAVNAREKAELQEALGAGTKGARPRSMAAALRDLESEQDKRTKRFQRDALDRVLTELTSYFRDVLTIQTKARTSLLNAELANDITDVAQTSSPEHTIDCIDAILECRTALETNVAPLLAMEALMIRLQR